MISAMGAVVIGETVDERGVGSILQKAAHQIGQQIFMAADGRIDTARLVDQPALATTCS